MRRLKKARKTGLPSRICVLAPQPQIDLFGSRISFVACHQFSFLERSDVLVMTERHSAEFAISRRSNLGAVASQRSAAPNSGKEAEILCDRWIFRGAQKQALRAAINARSCKQPASSCDRRVPRAEISPRSKKRSENLSGNAEGEAVCEKIAAVDASMPPASGCLEDQRPFRCSTAGTDR